MTDAKALRRVTTARAALLKAQTDYPAAIKEALESNGSDDVARAAGVSRSAMYKVLRTAYGPRKP